MATMGEGKVLEGTMFGISPAHCRPLGPYFPKVSEFEGRRWPVEAAGDLQRMITLALESSHTTETPVPLRRTSTPYPCVNSKVQIAFPVDACWPHRHVLF